MVTNIRDVFFQISTKEHYTYINTLLRDDLFNYAIIKGEALSIQAYGKCGQRQSSDVDILLPRKDLYNFKEMLHNCGFHSSSISRHDEISLLSWSHQISPWLKEIPPWGHIIVDLNFDVFWGEYEGKRIDTDEFLSDAIELEIYGIKVKTLPPLKALIQLALHHYKDMNSIFLLATRKRFNQDMFKDVYYLLKNNLESIPLDRLHSMCNEYEIIPYMFYVLYYTGQIFNDDILKQYIEAFRTPEGEALLDCYGLCGKERKEWKYDFKTRLESNDLFELIKDDLTEKDLEKISFNKKIFGGQC